jgi:hypothetical protein
MRLNHISRHIFLDKNFCYLKKYNIYIIYMPTKRRYRKTRSKGTNRRYRKTRSKGKLTYKMRGWHRGGDNSRRSRSRNSGRSPRLSGSLQFPLNSNHNPSVPLSNATTRKANKSTVEKNIRDKDEEDDEETGGEEDDEETGGEGRRQQRRERRRLEKEAKLEEEARAARKKLDEEAKRQRPGSRGRQKIGTYPDADSDALTAEEAAARLERRESWRRRHHHLLKRAAAAEAEAAGKAGGGYKRKRKRRRTRKMFKV